MRKLVATALLAAVVSTGASVPANAGKKPKKPKATQTVEGSVALPAPYTDGTCFFGAHRRANLVAQRQAQGIVGFDFDVDPKTEGGKFKLEPSDPAADLDISFYMSIGDIQDPAGAPSNLAFETREAGGESGTIPPGYPIAIVCMVTGENVGFTYTATR
jgi:hypothetical protein